MSGPSPWMVGPKISLMRIVLDILVRPVLGPGLRRLADAHRDDFRPARLAPVVEPACDHFGGGTVVAEHLVEMTVLDGVVEMLAQRAELEIIAHEAGGVELLRAQDDLHLVIMPVQTRARMMRRQVADGVRRRKGEPLGNGVHGRPYRERRETTHSAPPRTVNFITRLLVLTG